MVEKGMLFLSEHFRVFELICSVFMAFVVRFMIDRFFVVRRQWYWKALRQLAVELHTAFYRGILPICRRRYLYLWRGFSWPVKEIC